MRRTKITENIHSGDGEGGSIYSLSFNQSFECFVCADENGFRIYNSNPLKEIRRETFRGGVQLAEMLYRSCYVALVGSASSAEFGPTKVLLWDCSIGKAVIELEMGEPVLAVRLRRDLIVVVVAEAVAVFTFTDIPIQILRARSAKNAHGLCAISASNEENPLLAFPSPAAIGAIELVNLSRKDQRRRIYAHNHRIHMLAFNSSGSLLASASEKGTLIRVFDALNGTPLREFRRGTNNAKISCLNFSADSKMLCVSSNHSTIHVFQLDKPNENFTFFKGVPSAIKIFISNGKKCGISQCAFERNSASIIAVGKDGSYYHFCYDKNTGQYCKQSYCLFTELNSKISGNG